MASAMLTIRHSASCFRCAFLKCKSKTFLDVNLKQVRASHYETLGIPRTATTEEIRAAFLKRSKEYHPDMMINKKSDHGQFVKVNEAYSVLSKRTSRRDYDFSLAKATSSRVHGRSAQSSSAYNHQSPYFDSQDYQEMARGFYDPQMYSMRDKSKDAQYKDAPVYGIRGLGRVSNVSIVIGCLVFMMVGIVVHSVVVKKSSDLLLKNLSDRDTRIHRMWLTAKQEAEEYRRDELVKRLKDVQEAQAGAQK